MVGHHGPYLEWMAKGLVARGFHLTIITSPESMRHPSAKNIAEIPPDVHDGQVRIISEATPTFSSADRHGIGGLVVRELRYWLLVRRWYRTYVHRVRPDVVFLPGADYCLHALGLLGSAFGGSPWVGIAMRPSFHYRGTGVVAPRPSLINVKKALFHRVLKDPHLRCLLTLDEPLADYLTSINVPVCKYALLPQPTNLANLPDPVLAKRWIGVAEERKLILVYGAITQRKGIFELVRALLQDDFPRNVDIIAAGQLSTEVADALASHNLGAQIAAGRLRFLNRVIPEVEERTLFAAADIVWLGYTGHYASSGVLVQAASARRPIIACEQGVIGWQAKRHRLGEVVNPADSAMVIRAIRSLLRGTNPLSYEGVTDLPELVGSLPDALDVLEQSLVGARCTAN